MGAFLFSNTNFLNERAREERGVAERGTLHGLVAELARAVTNS